MVGNKERNVFLLKAYDWLTLPSQALLELAFEAKMGKLLQLPWDTQKDLQFQKHADNVIKRVAIEVGFSGDSLHSDNLQNPWN